MVFYIKDHFVCEAGHGTWYPHEIIFGVTNRASPVPRSIIIMAYDPPVT
jgi:hypothetical protein